MKNFIKKYPWLSYSILTGVFIFSFLTVFKPFGFQKAPEDILNPLFLGYGLIGFLLVLLNHLLFGGLIYKHFPEKGSMVRVWLWPMWITLTITLVNVAYTRWFFVKTGFVAPEHFQPGPVIVGTLAIGALCIFIIEMIDQNIRLKQNLKTQQLANQKLKERLPGDMQNQKKEEVLLIKAQNERDTYQFNPGDLLFMNARENYVAIHYKKDKNERILIRNTISSVADQLKQHYPVFFRCHRGYIVNIRKIQSVTGNAQGFRLFLDQIPEAIPVSRSYVPEFRDIVRKHL